MFGNKKLRRQVEELEIHVKALKRLLGYRVEGRELDCWTDDYCYRHASASITLPDGARVSTRMTPLELKDYRTLTTVPTPAKDKKK